MDELTKHRKRRLKALIEAKPFLGNQSAFAERAGVTSGRITQLLDATEAFGERAGINMARKLGIKDERYFEQEFPAEGSAREPISTPADDVIQALRILAGIENRAKRMSIAQMVAMVAADPSDLENVAEMLRDLLPQPQLARASQSGEPAGLTFKGLGSGGLNPNVRGDSVSAQGTQRRKER